MFALWKKLTQRTEKAAQTSTSGEKRLRATLHLKNNFEKNEKISRIIGDILHPSDQPCDANALNILVAEMLNRRGMVCQIIDGKHDSSIDIEIFDRNLLIGAVQCKAYDPTKTTGFVKKSEVAKFYASCKKREIAQMICVTTTNFTSPVITEYQSEMLLIDRKALWQLIMRHFPAEAADWINSVSLSKLDPCEQCSHGRLVQQYSTKKKRYYQCEQCKALYNSQRRFWKYGD